jgi:hypothetical protein
VADVVLSSLLGEPLWPALSGRPHTTELGAYTRGLRGLLRDIGIVGRGEGVMGLGAGGLEATEGSPTDADVLGVGVNDVLGIERLIGVEGGSRTIPLGSSLTRSCTSSMQNLCISWICSGSPSSAWSSRETSSLMDGQSVLGVEGPGEIMTKGGFIIASSVLLSARITEGCPSLFNS